MLHWPRPGETRLFLALVVVVHHSTRLSLGPWAVFCFFVLSGYWIASMWHDKYQHIKKPALVFWASRLFRLLPMFWLANLLSIEVAIFYRNLAPALADLSPLIWISWIAVNLVPLGYYFLPQGLNPLAVAWSLDAEIQFYLLSPAVLWLLSRDRVGGLLATVLAILSFCSWIKFTSDPAAMSVPLFSYGLFFLLGVLAAKVAFVPSNALAGFSMLTALSFVASALLGPTEFRSLFINPNHADGILAAIQLPVQSMLALVTVPFLLHTVHQPSIGHDRILGELAYLVYLFHWPVFVVYSINFGALPILQRIPYFLAAWLATFAISVLVYRVCDRPLERWRKRWLAGMAKRDSDEATA